MNSESVFNLIDESVRAVCREGKRPSPFANELASIFYSGESIARGWGFDWVDGEGYSPQYYDAVLKGIQHTLKAEPRSREAREFYGKFL